MKVVANMATYPARRAGLERVVRALAPQVGQLNLVLNQYEAILPKLEGIPNLNQILPEEDTKDAGKFLPDISGADWVFYVDDDLLYPPDFVAKTLTAMKSLPPGRWLGGYHGSIYARPRFSLRPKRLRRWLRACRGDVMACRTILWFRKALEAPLRVDQIGSGTAVVAGSSAPPFSFMRDSQRFVDVRLARWCFEQGISPVCLPRAADWLVGLRYDETIYREFTLANSHCVTDEIRCYAFRRSDVGKVAA